MTWKGKLAVDGDDLGGEPAFAKKSLAVRQIGGMLIKGVRPKKCGRITLLFKDEDIEFARLHNFRVSSCRPSP